MGGGTEGAIMGRMGIIAGLVGLLLVSESVAEAQCYVVADASSGAWGVAPGCDFTTSGTLRPGAIVGVYHPYTFAHAALDVDAYATLSWYMPRDWLFIAYAGGGVSQRAEDWAPSARLLLYLTRTTRAAPLFSIFSMYTPSWNAEGDDLFLAARLGLTFGLVDGVRLKVYLQTAVSVVGESLSVGPGGTLVWFL